MPNLGSTELSGEGWLNFNDQHSVFALVVFGYSLPTAQFRSVVVPRRVMHAGWFALGYSPTGALGVTNGLILWHKYLEFEHEQMLMDPPLVVDGLLYRLPLGHQYNIDVYWNW